MSDLKNTRLSRRTFLKGSAGTIAAALAASSLPSLARAANIAGTQYQIPHVQQTVTLRWIEWITPEISEEKMQTVLKGFAATDAGKKIAIERISMPFAQIHDTVVAQHLAKKTPDILNMNGPWQVEFADLGILEPLDGYLAKETKDWVDALVKGPMQPWKGKTYLVPLTSIPFLLYYNEKKLADAGFTKPPTTWAEVEAMAPKLTDPAKNTYAFASGMAAKSPYNGPEIELFPLIYQENDTVLKDGKPKLTSPAAVKALKWYIKLVNDLKVYAPGVTTNIEKDKLEAFGAEQTALMDSNVAHVTVLMQRNAALKFNLAPLPSDATFGTVLTGWNTSMAADGKDKSASWEFVRYLAGPEGNALMTLAAKHLPGNNKADIGEMIKAEPRLQVPLDILKKGRTYMEGAAMPNQTECARIFTEQVVEALSGKKTPEDALKFANDEWVKIFATAGM
jgi:multiple sugar transport system substrate-binding protein